MIFPLTGKEITQLLELALITKIDELLSKTSEPKTPML